MNRATQKLVQMLEHTVHTIVFRVECPTPEKTQLLDALHDFKVEIGAIPPDAEPDDSRDLESPAEGLLPPDSPQPASGGKELEIVFQP